MRFLKFFVSRINHFLIAFFSACLVSQAFFFFLAGVNGVSNTLSFLLYELAINQDIQEKLYKDLIACHPTDDVDYENLKSGYLDRCIKETMRKYTTTFRVFRQAMNDYEFDTFKVKKGQTVGVSLINLHYDEKLFKNPNQFRPERFETDELTFEPIPFADGPR